MIQRYHLQSAHFAVENIDILDVVRDKNHKYAHRNGRSKHAFLYTVRGSICYHLQGEGARDLILRAGELMFIPKHCVYAGTYLEDGTEIKMVQFDSAGEDVPSYLTLPQTLAIPDAGEQIEAFFKPTRNHTVGHPFYYLSRLYELLWQIDCYCAGIPAKYRRLQPALREIAEHYGENRKVADYAALCDLSEPAFRRLFGEYTGRSPIEYRNDLRLADARTRLQSGEYNVSEAAESAGFSNLSFFIRLYKKKYGHTPKKE